MSTYVIAPDAALALIDDETPPTGGHHLMAPSVLRSHVAGHLFDAVRRGELTQRDAEARLVRLAGLKLRLLGDRVLQRTALRLAAELELDDWGYVEYLALARLHADAVVTADPLLTRQKVVPVATLDVLR